MNLAQTKQFVRSTFSGATIVIDDRWAVQDSEADDLAKCFYEVLEVFPVKIEDNPLILQRVMAIFGLIIALIAIFSTENRLAETLKGNNNGLIGKAQKQENTDGSGKFAGNTENSASLVS